MRTGVYSGSFDPPTAGHLSVIERAAKLFDRLIVLVAVNDAKRATFTLEERAEMLREAAAGIPGVEVASTRGMVVDAARAAGAAFIVRGVRSLTDFDAEAAMAAAHHALAPDIVTLFVPARPDLAFVSSSALRELARLGADIERFCPPGVARRLRGKAEAAHATL